MSHSPARRLVIATMFLANMRPVPGQRVAPQTDLQRLLVKMEPRHLKFYLEFLNGERPMVAAHGWKRFTRKQHRALPTRVRCVEPDWSQEDGYYEFDGMSLTYVTLTEHARLVREPRPRRRE